MANLQTTVSTYNTTQRATKIYQTVVDIFDWDKSSDCVTPLDLALKQLEGAQIDGTLCIPGAGIGTYVLAALQKGFKPERIYAVELDAKYYELGSAMFERFGVNFILSDFLIWKPNMQFDAIVGNPPFQNGGNSAFYTMFFRRTGELLKEGGYFSLVSPSKAAAKFLPRVLVEETPDYLGITSDAELFKAVGLTEAEIGYLNMWNEVTA